MAVGGKFTNRLVIPFYDNEDKIYSYQCRALFKNMEPKYLGRRDCRGAIFGYYQADFNRAVVVLEGIIDSLFVENAIGVTGLKVYIDGLDKIKRKFFLLDDDADGRRVSTELLMRGEYVFLWTRYLQSLGIPHNKNKKTDINDIMIKLDRSDMIKFEDIRPYFSNSLYDRIY